MHQNLRLTFHIFVLRKRSCGGHITQLQTTHPGHPKLSLKIITYGLGHCCLAKAGHSIQAQQQQSCLIFLYELTRQNLRANDAATSPTSECNLSEAEVNNCQVRITNALELCMISKFQIERNETMNSIQRNEAVRTNEFKRIQS